MTYAGSLAVDYPHAGALLSICESGRTLPDVRGGLHEAFTVYDFIERINPLLLPLKNSPLATFKITRFKGAATPGHFGLACADRRAQLLFFYQSLVRRSCRPSGKPALT